MASGGRREFPVQIVSERELSQSECVRKYGERQSERTGTSARESHEKRRRGDAERRVNREIHDVTVKSTSSTGLGREKRTTSKNSALQLEHTSRSGRRPHANGVRLSAGKKEDVSPRVRDKEQRRADNVDDQRVRREGGGEDTLQKFKKMEMRTTRAIQMWRDSCGRYHDIKSLMMSAWSLYVCVLERNMEQAVRDNLGQRIWRNIHYPTIEILRKQRQQQGSINDEECELLPQVLQLLTTHYTDLLENLQNTYKFSLDDILTSGLDTYTSRKHQKKVLLVVIPCHWCLVCLGDLSRYQQQLATPPIWAKPRSYYLKAIQLAPKMGRPYNQMAVIAINAHRRLDAVYYYMRSLFAKTPVNSAHDNLVGLFEENYRKALKAEQEREKEREELKKKELREKKRQEKRQKSKITTSDRHEILFESGQKEVWLIPGSQEWYDMKLKKKGKRGGRVGDVSEVDKGKEEVAKKGLVSEDGYSEPEEENELMRQLISAFLIAHGKLYTKIGIDDMRQSEMRFIKLWRKMVCASELDLESARRLVKMTIINICSIDMAIKTNESESGKKFYFNLAFHLVLMFIRELVERCDYIIIRRREEGEETALSESDSGSLRVEKTGSEVDEQTGNLIFDRGCLSENQQLCLEEISMLLPSVRVWLEWIVKMEDLWLPLITQENKTNFAAVLIQLEQCLKVFNTSSTADFSEWAGLWEDGMLMGFMPLKAAVTTETSLATPSLYKLTTEERKRQDLVRVVLMLETYKNVTSHTHFNEGGGVSFIVGSNDEEEAEDSGDDVVVEGYSEEEEGEDEREGREGEDEGEDEGEKLEQEKEDETIKREELDRVDSDIELLKAQKERLSLEIRERSQVLTNTQSVLQEAASLSGREIVVCARYLVPDTNGFVDHLTSIKRLVKCGHFIVTVPLVVVSELGGLSKGGVDKEGGKEMATRGKRLLTGAKLAVEYIQSDMGSCLQVLTTRGNLLQSLSFTAEVTHKASNDDLILQSSLNLRHKLSSSSVPSPPTSTDYSIMETVVLLTDDRNLRVKAHAANVIVKDIPHFMDISKLS